MENTGVVCNVSECVNYREGNRCRLNTIEVTHGSHRMYAENSVGEAEMPHYCGSYRSK